jgi:hypothetical protein
VDTNREAVLTREALRLCDRYVNEIVLGFGLCPWAEPALRTGRVGRAVCLSAVPSPADCLPFFDAFGAATEPVVDIGLLLFPRHAAGWAGFDSFAERVRRADRARRGSSGATPLFLVAAFHPDGASGFTNSNEMLSFLRRTPDPLLQLVRADIIDGVRKTQPTASEDVARRNHDALVSDGSGPRGVDALDRAVRAIRADRDLSYARLGLDALPHDEGS